MNSSKAKGYKYLIQNSIVQKDQPPCKSTKHEIHPHRQNKDHYDKAVLVAGIFTQDQCQRKGQHQAYPCHQK